MLFFINFLALKFHLLDFNFEFSVAEALSLDSLGIAYMLLPYGLLNLYHLVIRLVAYCSSFERSRLGIFSFHVVIRQYVSPSQSTPCS